MSLSTFDRVRHRAPFGVATALTVVFGLQLIRILLPSMVGYLREVRDIPSLTLGPIAFLIFSASFLVPLFARLFDVRRAYWLSTAGVALLRLIEQFSTSPPLDLYLSAAGVILFTWHLPLALRVARAYPQSSGHQFGFPFLLGVSADTALHIASGTLDLSWHVGPFPLALVALLVVIQLLSLRQTAAQIETAAITDRPWPRSPGLVAYGAWLFLQLIVFQNVARLSSLTGLDTPAAGGLIVLGNALALAAVAWLWRAGLAHAKAALLAGLLLIATLLAPQPTGPLAIVLLLAGQVLSFLLIMLVFDRAAAARRHGLLPITLANGFAQIIFVALMLVYYLLFDLPLGFRSPTLLPLAALLLVAGAWLAVRGLAPAPHRALTYGPALAAASLLLLPLGLALAWRTPQPSIPGPDNRSLRVMSYNLHNGFDLSGRLDLEALAQVIEESDADLIALQEVSRGWLVWGAADMLTWLSHRLDMPYVYGPTAGAQWGNALLSRYPLLHAQNLPLPPDDLALRRGYIFAQVDLGAGALTVLATHFTHQDWAGEIRLVQASELLSTWNHAPHALILGDLNALPTDDEMRLLADAGFVNIAARLSDTPPYTYSAANPVRQIDYLWATPDLAYDNFAIIPTTASDHLPLVATITIP